MDNQLFFVGFFSPSEPGMVQRWRPKQNSPESVSKAVAKKRFRRLTRRMKAGKKVDGLRVASVAIYTERGDAIRSMTADGTEAKGKPDDGALYLQTIRVRGSA